MVGVVMILFSLAMIYIYSSTVCSVMMGGMSLLKFGDRLLNEYGMFFVMSLTEMLVMSLVYWKVLFE